MLPDEVRALALMLPEASEGAHMGHPDFRVGGKIFATLWPDEGRAVVKLSPEMQAVMVEAEPDVFEPVPGSWGRRGRPGSACPTLMSRRFEARSWRPGGPSRPRGSSRNTKAWRSIRLKARCPDPGRGATQVWASSES
jgi:hypothetical protein